MTRRLEIHACDSGELLGPGDLLRPWSAAGGQTVEPGGRWRVHGSAQVAALDAAFDLNTVVTDPRGKATTYCWEKPGRVTKVIDAKGHKRSATYTPSSNVESFSDGSGASPTTFGYNARDSLTSVGQPAGETSSFEYGNASHPYLPSKATSAQGTSQAFAYSSEGNLEGVSDGQSPTQVQARLEYNGQSGGVCPNDPGTEPGTLRCAIDGNGNQTRYGHDPRGNLTKVTPPLPLGPTTLTYDSLSRVKTIKDGKGQTTSYTYDALDRMTRIAFGDGSSVAYEYDPAGNRTARVDSAHGTTAYAYDGLNRRTRDTLPGGRVTDYGYDSNSNLTSLSDITGTVGYAYDEVNRLASLTEPGGAQSTFGYDGRGNRTSTSFPNGVVETRSYDTSDKLLSILARKGTAPPLTDFAYTYRDGAQRETRLRQTARDRDGETATYSYDALDRLTRAVTRGAGGAVLDDRGYGFDGATNRTRATVNGASTTFAYNEANQLCWKASGTPAGGCSSPPSGATSYTYDPNGNMLGDSSGLAFSYNARNQTTSITSVGIFGQTTAQGYAGDGQGELVSDGPLQLQNNMLGLSVQDGGQYGRVAFVREPEGRPFSTMEAGRRHYYLTDALGSTVDLANTSATSGGHFEYGPYGNITSATGRNVENYLWYQGADYVNVGYHFGQRYYHPELGRWTQQDPLDQAGDLRQGNRYAYVGGDPINLTDPSGMGIDIFEGLGIVGGGITLGATCTQVATGIGAAACLGGWTTYSGFIGDSLRD